jgi:hypothetical protein
MAGVWTTYLASASFLTQDTVPTYTYFYSSSASDSVNSPPEYGSTSIANGTYSIIGLSANDSFVAYTADIVGTDYTEGSSDIIYNDNTASFQSYRYESSANDITSGEGLSSYTATISYYTSTRTASANSNETETIISFSQQGGQTQDTDEGTFSANFNLAYAVIETTTLRTATSTYNLTVSKTETEYRILTNSENETLSASSTYLDIELNSTGSLSGTREYFYTAIVPSSAKLYYSHKAASYTINALKIGYGSFDGLGGDLYTADLVAGFTATAIPTESIANNIVFSTNFLLVEGNTTSFLAVDSSVGLVEGSEATASGAQTFTLNSFTSSTETTTITISSFTTQKIGLPFWTTTSESTYSKWGSESYTASHSTEKSFYGYPLSVGGGSDEVNYKFAVTFLSTSIGTSTFHTAFYYPTYAEEFSWTKEIRTVFTQTLAGNGLLYSQNEILSDPSFNDETTWNKGGEFYALAINTFMSLATPITDGVPTNYYLQTAVFGNFAPQISGETAYWEINSEARAGLTTFSALLNRCNQQPPYVAPTYFDFGNTSSSFSNDPLSSSILSVTINQSVSRSSTSTTVFQTLSWSSGLSTTTRTFNIEFFESTGTRLYTSDGINDSDSDVPQQYSAGDPNPIAYISPADILNTNGQGYGASYGANGFFFRDSSTVNFLSGTFSDPVSAEYFGASSIQKDPAFAMASIISLAGAGQKFVSTNKDLVMFYP